MNRLRIGIALAVASLVLVLAAWPGQARAGKEDNTVVVSLSSPIPTMDPRDHRVRVAIIMNWHVFDPLFKRDSKTGELKPGLATSVRPIDELVWEVKLRKGVKFHNGEPFTAEAVKYTIETMLDKKNKLKGRGNVTWIRKIVVKDPYTLHISTKKPYPLFREQMTVPMTIAPGHAKKVGKKGLAREAVGTGPYKFVSWTKGVKLVLTRNENYWGPKPAIKTLIFRPIKEPATRIAELIRGGVHVIRQVPPDQIAYIRKSGQDVRSTPILRAVYLQIDAIQRDKRSNPAFKDRRVRRAVAHAVNVDGIIKHILQGRAMRSATGINPLAFGYDNDAKPIPYDPARAKRLLAEAGYPNGFDCTLYSYSGSVVAVRQVAEAIQGDLRKVGIRAKIFHFDNVGQYSKMGRAGKRGDLTLASWGSRSIFDSHQILNSILRTGKPYSYVNLPALDKEIAIGESNIDPKVRMAAYKRAQQVLLKEVPWIPLYGQHEILGINKDLDFAPSGDEILRLYEAKWK